MKLPVLPTILLAAMLGVAAFAAPADNSLGTITTSFGRSYHDCRVCQVDPDGVIFVHQKGVAKILFGEIPEPLRAKLGYDAQRASDYAKDLSEQKRRKLELQAELKKESLKAQAAVSVAEIQSAGMVQQAAISSGGWGAYLPYTGGLYGWDGSVANNGYGGPIAGNYGQGWSRGNCGNSSFATLPYRALCGSNPINTIAMSRPGLGPVNCARLGGNGFPAPAFRGSVPALGVTASSGGWARH